MTSRNIKHTFVRALATGALFVGIQAPALAADCPNTPWQPSNGRTCANMGLNSNAPVCKGGYATLCDDTRDAIRVCRSAKPCQRAASAPNWNNYGNPAYWQNQWNNTWSPNGNHSNQGTSQDYINYRGKQFHCTDWNYRAAKPCASGKRNPDCKGDCR